MRTTATLRLEHASLYPDLAPDVRYQVVWREHEALLLDAGRIGLRFGLERHFLLEQAAAVPVSPVPGTLAQSSSSVASPKPVPLGRGETILVAGGRAEFQRLLIEYLEHLGYVALVAESTERALDLARAFQVALVLADDELRPDTAGVDLVCRIRQEQPRIPVLMLTGSSPSQLPRGTVHHLDGVLHQPFALSDLGRLVATVLRAAKRA